MASVPTPHQFAVGEVATADNINTYYSGISFLENPPVASLFQITPQSVTGSGETPISLDGSLLDTYGGHSTVTNNTRYTFQVAGIYLIGGGVAWSANATGVRAASLRLNGSSDLRGSQAILPTITVGGINTNVPTVTVMSQVSVGDYVELMGTQTSGGTLATQTGGNNTSTLFVQWIHA